MHGIIGASVVKFIIFDVSKFKMGEVFCRAAAVLEECEVTSGECLLCQICTQCFFISDVLSQLLKLTHRIGT